MQKNTEQMKLENDQIEVIVNYHGAGLRSLKKKATDQEYLWNADAKYWGRTSPVLFPFVGGVKNKVYRYEGKEYPMNQHGFARDMEFSLVSQSADEVWFALEDTEETYKVYPFHFHLEIGYRLEDASVSVMWKVKNINDKEMHFAIGAHPAFFCPLHEGEKQSEYCLGFRNGQGKVPEALVNTVFGEGGVVTTQKKEYKLTDGCLPMDEHLFDGDALVIEDHQIQKVVLMDPQKKEYLAVAEGYFAEKTGEIHLPISQVPGSSPIRMEVNPTDGKKAHTYWKVERQFQNAALLRVHITTGRTHQIRVHLAGIGHPLLGDPLYGKTCGGFSRAALHAWKLILHHPVTGEKLVIEAAVPGDFKEYMGVGFPDAPVPALSPDFSCGSGPE